MKTTDRRPKKKKSEPTEVTNRPTMAQTVPGTRLGKVHKPGARAQHVLEDAIKPGAHLRSLLDEPVRFVGSSRDELKASLSLDAARASNMEIVNEPVDAQPSRSSKHTNDNADASASTAGTSLRTVSAPTQPLYTPRIIPRFPRAHMRAAGLHNRGNTCYMNSVMQSLLHTPPLATALLTQSAPTLLGRYGVPRTQKQAVKAANSFNALTEMKDFFARAYSGASAVSPTAFVSNLRKFARPLRPGRQEDAHEYLRLLLEALQQACTCFAGKDVKPNDPILSTTLIQRIFGGRLRSRVTCYSCRHNSDTYDPMLDLSLDVRKGIHTVKQALDAFTAAEALADKYQCDHCQRRVEATKRFSIDQAPMVLTVHLKRFGIFGNKINKPISYSDRLHLGRYMSERDKGLGADVEDEPDLGTLGAAQQYRLFAIVHHYGSGPNVGHYVASVRSADGQWLRMDDSFVSKLPQCPLDDPSAYLLFYLREPITMEESSKPTTMTSPKKRKAASIKRDDNGHDHGPGVSADIVMGEPVSRAEYARMRESLDAGTEDGVDNDGSTESPSRDNGGIDSGSDDDVVGAQPVMSKKEIRRRKRRKASSAHRK